MANGQYRYMTDLLALDLCRPDGCHATAGPAPKSKSVTSLARLEAWRVGLESHPDQEFARYILEGLSNGFRIGFDYSKTGCRKAKRNTLSAKRNAAVVDAYLPKKRCWEE